MIQFEIKKNHKGNGEFSYDLQALAASFTRKNSVW